MRLLTSLFVTACAIILSSCATLPDRVAVAPELRDQAMVPGFTNIRFAADATVDELRPWQDRMLADRDNNHADAPFDLLAISSGTDDGAFGAGYLVGWTATGTRPEFAIVVGVSTGALMAPFAFLGPEEDPSLARLYTTIEADDIFRPRPVSGVLGGPALASSRPLQEIIEREITSTLVARLANEHRRGRRLLILTTNLDTQRGTVWDIGEIATAGTPQAERLIEQVLLASASIPVLLPPVLIDVAAGETTFTEMHVDGGTTSSFFAVPQAIIFAQDRQNLELLSTDIAITLLYNGRVRPEYETVPPRTFAILEHSVRGIIAAADQRTIAAYQAFADRNAIAFKVVSIADTFDDQPFEDRSRFDQAYMNALFEYGRAAALAGE